ncbi:c-type cytochrome [methanotrophic endosymbiont of Bathymodiolus puteoserpentis (Logatchev)]|jgi:cytochrome c553|uniref:c-type cytochrome n=1 Tax=methanotrophic endosymbiont of Bathymodiolus puteoserpentis (Logatchev) TaxID=343235 RepID=UPI0013CC39E9|nr:c-type cytochrome [methanotrophic endosymbiont of Bathymodiolus puteoserpentis (Logatchev)]SHE23521.1 Cytochrome c4 [methanotrophic endosymbiont of Bathymodiolus puteoserpentis (Logatchev)]
MKKSLLALSVSIVLLNITGTAQAKTEGTATTNVAAGKAKSAPCAGCHGEDGNSMMPLFPKLADQNEEYLVQQMEAFKDGTRTDAVMGAMVAGLSTQDMQDIAAFYEQQKVTKNTLPPLELDDDDDEELEAEQGDNETLAAQEQVAVNKQTAQEQQDALLALGYDVYRNGDLEREISACIACHGPYGEGNKPAAFPALQGQHADYLIKTLTDFKNNVRSNNPDNMMHMIAHKMTEEEIKGIAYHVSVMESN